MYVFYIFRTHNMVVSRTKPRSSRFTASQQQQQQQLQQQQQQQQQHQ